MKAHELVTRMQAMIADGELDPESIVVVPLGDDYFCEANFIDPVLREPANGNPDIMPFFCAGSSDSPRAVKTVKLG